MKEVVYVTGNSHKAKYFAEMVGMEVPHMKIDVDEIQSLNLREIVEHKVKQAYKQVKRPVIVEDTKLVFNALGQLPGPFIKFFLEELNPEGLCRILDGYDDRSATAGAAIAYYDGSHLEIFERQLHGQIAKEPAGDSGFGWNKIFLPEDNNKVLGEMDQKEFKAWYVKIKPFEEIAEYLRSIDNT